MEFFVNFDPEHSEKYFNIEVNPIGTVNAAFRASRSEFVALTNEEINALQIKPFVNADEIYASAIAYLDSKNVEPYSAEVVLGTLLTAYFNELVFHLDGKNVKEQKNIYHDFKQNDNVRTLLKNSLGKFNKLLLIMGNSLYGIQLRLIKRRYG